MRAGIYAGLALKFKIRDYGQAYRGYPDGSAGSEPPYGWVRSFPRAKIDIFNIDARAGLFVQYNFKRSKLHLMPLYRLDLLNTFRGYGNDWKHASTKGIAITVYW
jgi:hypothetical protein